MKKECKEAIKEWACTVALALAVWWGVTHLVVEAPAAETNELDRLFLAAVERGDAVRAKAWAEAGAAYQAARYLEHANTVMAPVASAVETLSPQIETAIAAIPLWLELEADDASVSAEDNADKAVALVLNAIVQGDAAALPAAFAQVRRAAAEDKANEGKRTPLVEMARELAGKYDPSRSEAAELDKLRTQLKELGAKPYEIP